MLKMFRTPWAALAIASGFATAAVLVIFGHPEYGADGAIVAGASVAKAGFIFAGAVIGAYIINVPTAIQLRSNMSAMLMLWGFLALLVMMALFGAVAIYLDSAFEGLAGMAGGGYGGALREFFKRRTADDNAAEEAAKRRTADDNAAEEAAKAQSMVDQAII